MLGSSMTYKQMRVLEEKVGRLQRAAYQNPELAKDGGADSTQAFVSWRDG